MDEKYLLNRPKWQPGDPNLEQLTTQEALARGLIPEGDPIICYQMKKPKDQNGISLMPVPEGNITQFIVGFVPGKGDAVMKFYDDIGQSTEVHRWIVPVQLYKNPERKPAS